MIHVRLPGTSRRRFLHDLDTECALLQPPRHGNANWLVLIKLAEWEALRDHLGAYGCSAIMKAVSDILAKEIPEGQRILQTFAGEITIVVRDRSEAALDKLLSKLSRKIVSHRFTAGGEPVRVTPAIGFAAFSEERTSRSGLRCARSALEYSLAHLDLRPVPFSDLLEQPSRWQEWMIRLGVRRSIRFGLHVVLALILALGLPLATYFAIGEPAAGVLTRLVFIITVVVLVTTATLINIENVLSLKTEEPPEEPGAPYPKASAIVAAYLPNEAATVTATVEALLAMDYPGELQVILAYNTPHDLPVEKVLRRTAGRDRRFVPLRVADSTSKAQNINAALSIVTGQFVAVFDADHRPQSDSFTRAWHWLSNGADVVQGHCVVRNGSTSLLSRLVAVEFEQIYGASHPGGARLRGYGIFGGSNGYWKTSVLRELRMRSSMLTEDIDSTMRAVSEGRKIVSDPGLISTELAPVTLRSLTHQRLRWAQGWFQVSLRHLRPLLKSPNLTLGQKAGSIYLLAWREMFPWFSLQVFPVLAYWILQAGSVEALDWKVPILLVATVYVLSTGPLQTLIAHRNSAPLIRSHKSWFFLHLMLANLYSEFITLLTRVAHLRQLLGEREWRITPRSAEDNAAALSPLARPYEEGDLPPRQEAQPVPVWRFESAGAAPSRG